MKKLLFIFTTLIICSQLQAELQNNTRFGTNPINYSLDIPLTYELKRMAFSAITTAVWGTAAWQFKDPAISQSNTIPMIVVGAAILATPIVGYKTYQDGYAALFDDAQLQEAKKLITKVEPASLERLNKSEPCNVDLDHCELQLAIAESKLKQIKKPSAEVLYHLESIKLLRAKIQECKPKKSDCIIITNLKNQS